ncbi:hypothetical protein JOC75_003434 [Metabacillus crassostreae]|uniref:DUF6241 domain-containing protein n=1 Tax=Metabacillus crassostreae TaxID=929098 RepID=UPI001EF84381|nr:DUF6241 domain-containing protein [Metabacillus crassostreae]MBM7605411.1 hypothetical protein [Metabacillus crassostreae]
MIDNHPVSSSQVVEKGDVDNEENKDSTNETIVTGNPFGKGTSTLSEEDILNYMHGMSHQKVIAEEKWLHYEMTSERIQYLINEIESGDYENEEKYLSILNKWKEGDFSEADKDHNIIWRLQGGTVGEATGVMSAEQEESYLEKYEGKIQ